MPPKPKFTREEIITAAFDIAREYGQQALTARALGEKLGSSSRPIFTTFRNMEEVKEEVLNAALVKYGEYIRRGLSEERAFKGAGKEYIRFACDEPRLFAMLFMQKYDNPPQIDNVLKVIDDDYLAKLQAIKMGYELSSEAAERLYLHIFVYTHGIAVLCATGTCTFSEEEISRMLTEVFQSLLLKERKLQK